MINELYKYSGKEAAEHKVKPRYDVWFEIHNIKDSPSKQNKTHQEFLKTMKLPLVTQQHWDEYPTSLGFPRAQIKNKIDESFIIDDIGGKYTDYSNQISWMIALAIYMGYEEIHIYGVDMAANTEYNFQRASCQFFIGLAAGLGIKLLIPNSSELCKHYKDYGFDTDNAPRFRAKDRIKDLKARQQDMEKRLAEIEFFKDKLTRELATQAAVINNTITELKQERAKVEAIAEANTGLLAFLSKAPDKLEDYLKAREGIIKQVNEVEMSNKEVLDNIGKELNNQIIKREQEEKRVFMNIKLLNDEVSFIHKNFASIQGTIGECSHNLNNNLI